MRISDWSSDVCSSDLPGVNARIRPGDVAVAQQRDQVVSDRAAHRVLEIDNAGFAFAEHQVARMVIAVHEHLRSEERRVGKECDSTCRSRWSPYRQKKNYVESITKYDIIITILN